MRTAALKNSIHQNTTFLHIFQSIILASVGAMRVFFNTLIWLQQIKRFYKLPWLWRQLKVDEIYSYWSKFQMFLIFSNATFKEIQFPSYACLCKCWFYIRKDMRFVFLHIFAKKGFSYARIRILKPKILLKGTYFLEWAPQVTIKIFSF